jgi:hypothetical protein
VHVLEIDDRRRLGTVLLVYGALGFLLFAALAAGLLAAGSLLSDAPDRATAAIERVVAVLESTDQTLASVQTTLGNGGTTLTGTAATIDGAASTLTGMGSTLDDIGNALVAFSILGANPLGAVGGTVGTLADQVSGIGQQIAGLSSNLTTNAGDLATTATAIGELRSDLVSLRDTLVEVDLAGAGRTIQVVRYGLLAIVTWLAIGSALLAWWGWRLRQTPTPITAGPSVG